MAVKIRLQRHGKKGKPVFHIVVADARARRDGRYIERIGSYVPTTNPATIELDVDRAVDWLEKGAQPTDTARAILSYKGALLKKHLKGGVKKGAFSDEEVEKRFQKWLEEKEKAIQAKKEGLTTSKEQAKKEKHEAEKKINEARITAQQKALEPEPEAVSEVEAVSEEEQNDAEKVAEEIIKEDETATDAAAAEEKPEA